MRALTRTLVLTATLAAAVPALAQEVEPDTIRVDGATIIILDGSRFERGGGQGPFTFRFRGRDADGDGVRALERALRTPHVPALPGRVFSLDGESPDVFAARMHGDVERVFRSALDAEDRREADEIVRMEAEAREIAWAARRADGAERERLEADLRVKLDALFERKMAARADALESLEAELERRRARYETRRREQDAIVDRRLRSLLGEEDVLDW